ncbi:prolipoprotein diacylglyceryl transferase [Larkinella soli]|uniref:prolipoprotein diacylglyceryl transferase n=1 Tax=Larkinella soli TaxID=1770527 RepID=UPI000FFC760A|nr:prolipoprotein diacylglyceryl transferase [Larkinella soli]
MLQYILWDVDPEIFRIGSWPVRWYGLLFAAGFLTGVRMMAHIFRTEKKPLSDIDSLLITVVVSTILGARIGHFLFYEPSMFIQNPLRIITPPFDGLASHGGIIGICIGLWLYSRRPSSKATGQTFLWVTDRICIVAALAGAFIRFGNLMNSEIFGKPTHVPWAFVFLRDPDFSQVPRHPTQLYESFSCLVLFAVLFWYWKTHRKQSTPGTMSGLSLVWVFGLRFIWEFIKENQVAFEDDMSLNIGQLLSIPAIVSGLILLLRSFIKPASFISVALVIQSSGLCLQCDDRPALPVSGQAHSVRCEESTSDKQP